MLVCEFGDCSSIPVLGSPVEITEQYQYGARWGSPRNEHQNNNLFQ